MNIEQEILNSMKKKLSFSPDDDVSFSLNGYTTEKFDVQKFKELIPTISDKKLAFIDGGNTSLFESAQLSLDLIRVAAVVHDKGKYTSKVKLEVYALHTLEERESGLFFSTKLFFGDHTVEEFPELVEALKSLEKKLHFSTTDPLLAVGGKRASISIMSSVVRRFFELIVADFLVDFADFVVLDGSLECTYPYEDQLMDILRNHAKGKLVGVAKTSHLLTKKGNAVGNVLQSLAPFDIWVYAPLALADRLAHTACISFVKFHAKSQYVFRFETLSEDVLSVASLLAFGTNDPVFYGYPYGLIKVDALARVSNQEKEYYTTKFFVAAGKDAETLRGLMCSTNAHSVLDTISY